MTLVNSNNNTWVNNGTYQTKYFNYNAGSSDVINNCRMIVKEDFNINLGDNPNKLFQDGFPCQCFDQEFQWWSI